MSEKRRRQVLEGEVVSTSMNKTAVVRVTRRVRHPLYKKFVKKYNKYLAHIGSVETKIGDQVKIVSTRPISKRKCWQVSEVVRESIELER
ncbi:MAG: 30S ribosomal protein S17 [Candidatus Neomarinimicrobiota bacterium]